MAYYFLFPEIDSTIYSHPDRTKANTGHDEILEVVKEKGTANDIYYPSRILIKFNNEEIKTTVNDVIGFSDFNTKATCSLQLLATEHKNLTTILNLNVFAVSESWNEGSGRYSNSPTSSDGVSWVYRDNDINKLEWTTGSAAIIGSTYGSSSITINQLPTASAHELTINGVDFIGVLSSSLFESNNEEIYFDISSSVDAFGENLRDTINISSSITLVSASYTAASNTLILSGSNSGSIGNVIVTTSSIEGNDQGVFIASATGYSLQGGTNVSESIFAQFTTGSIVASGVTQGGGTWYTGSDFQSSQQFLYSDNLDTNFDVTSIVKKHYQSVENAGSYPTAIDNNGFLIKQPDNIESNTSNSFGELKYFSNDTHTIYPPRLVFKWDDSVHSKQSSAKQSGELNVSLYRNQEEYNQNDEAIFRIHVRDKYPTRQFASSSNFLNVGYLTTSSFYSIRDAHTEEEVIPFDNNCTKLSADNDGMFFKIFMKGLQPERYYRVLFKHTNNEGTTIYDNNYYFKVIR